MFISLGEKKTTDVFVHFPSFPGFLHCDDSRPFVLLLLLWSKHIPADEKYSSQDPENISRKIPKTSRFPDFNCMCFLDGFLVTDWKWRHALLGSGLKDIMTESHFMNICQSSRTEVSFDLRYAEFDF